MADYHKHLEIAKQKALNWVPPDLPQGFHDSERWRRAIWDVVCFYGQAIHAAECEGCAVKISNEFDPLNNLPFHNVFEVDHGPGETMADQLKAKIAHLEKLVAEQNDFLTTLQSQRDAYKTRIDALMKDGLIVDKTRYKVVFEGETESEVRVRLVFMA